jgi:cell division transport system permease protein
MLDDLPLPRLIVVRIAAGAALDLQQLRKSLSDVLPTASLDDHRGWIGRMRTMAGTAVFGGLLILALVIAATGLTVAFATRGAMASNRTIIEVLHFIGARNRFIAGRFQRHFLRLGLQGGLIGAGAAIIMFLVAQGLSAWFAGSAAEDQLGALFGRFSLGPLGYAALAGQALLVAVVTAATSRYTVNRTLGTVE